VFCLHGGANQKEKVYVKRHKIKINRILLKERWCCLQGVPNTQNRYQLRKRSEKQPLSFGN